MYMNSHRADDSCCCSLGLAMSKVKPKCLILERPVQSLLGLKGQLTFFFSSLNLEWCALSLHKWRFWSGEPLRWVWWADHQPVTHAVARLFAADPIDVLKVLELSEDMEGVSLEAGLCTSREGREETDLSFKINKKIQLSAPTKQLFPRKC